MWSGWPAEATGRLPAPPERQDDARGLRKVGDLRRSIDRILLTGFDAVGIADDVSIDHALVELEGIVTGGTGCGTNGLSMATRWT